MSGGRGARGDSRTRSSPTAQVVSFVLAALGLAACGDEGDDVSSTGDD